MQTRQGTRGGQAFVSLANDPPLALVVCGVGSCRNFEREWEKRRTRKVTLVKGIIRDLGMTSQLDGQDEHRTTNRLGHWGV